MKTPSGCLQQLAFMFLTVAALSMFATTAHAQVSSSPSAKCHVVDGEFTTCQDGSAEWSDVESLPFLTTNSYLYVNQDAARTFLHLMYDFTFRTSPIAPSEAVKISFDTVEQSSGPAALEHYDISIFGDGHLEVLENGNAIDPGRIAGAVGFHSSPNSTTPHLMAELQVPLTPGAPTTYSPDPIFWSATTPPTPPPPPPPPTCPTSLLACLKSQDQIDAWNTEAAAAENDARMLLSKENEICNRPLELLEQQLEFVGEKIQTAIAVSQALLSRADLPAATKLNLNNLFLAADEAAQEAVQDAQTGVPPTTALEAALAALAPAVQTVISLLPAGPTVAALAEVVADLTTAVALAVAVEAAVAVLISGSCHATILAEAAAEFAKADFLRALANDPPDPNFTVVATPVVPVVAAQPFTTAGTGFSPQVVSDLNALLENLEQQIALLQVIPTTINRVSGAVQAGNTFWHTQQANAARAYGSQMIPLLQNALSLRAALANDLQSSDIVFTFSTTDVQNALSLLQINGFPGNLTSALSQLGLNTAQQSEILQRAVSLPASLPSTLGTGVFPQAIADPSFATATNATVKAFTQLAAAPPAASLTQSFAFTIPGDYTAVGVGLRGGTAPLFGPPPASADISVSAIPIGATVVQAFLYWGMLDNGEDATLRNLTLNGNPITGTRIGSGPDTCWGRINSFTYRADVTPFVNGNGTYTLTNVALGGSILQEGASLVVVYQLAGAPTRTVIVSDGDVSIPLGTRTGTTSFSGFTAGAPVSAKTTFMVGDGQLHQFAQTGVSFTGTLGTLVIPGLFAANDGPLWDTDTFDVSGVVGAGSSSDSANVRLIGDCVLWSAQAFSVSTAPVTPTPVIATAAVVKTSAPGDTAVGGRGLNPGDAPTIVDKIEAIVLNRAIEGRTDSASGLATQLVDSLPPNILPPGQAQTVIQGVVNQLAAVDKVPPVISGMPASCTLWPPNHKLVTVATVTARDLLSGVAPGSFKITGTSNEPQNPSNPDIVVTPNSLGGLDVQLRADRLGTGTGRVYTLTATASDVAGNTAVRTSICTVPHDQGK